MNDLMSDAAIRAIGTLSSPVFLAGRDGASPVRMTLHVAQARDRKALAREAQDALAKAGIEASCTVREFDQRRIEAARSLQDLLPYFAHEGIVFDPTGSVIRANALVRFVAGLRLALGEAVEGAYLEAEGRALYVLLRGELDAAGREDLEAKCASAVTAWRAEDAGAFELPLRLCLQLPTDVPVVAVDRASMPPAAESSWWSRLQAGVMISGITALLGAATPRPAAAEGPAVSGVNAKLSGEGGVLGGDAAGVLDGSVTAPLGHSFGVQADAAYGTAGGRSLWGAAGQGFWRDPEKGLIGGFYSHATRIDPTTNITNNENRFGGEGEAYLGKITVSLAAGSQSGQVAHQGFAVPKIAWYPDDNTALSFGADIRPGYSLGLLGAEHQLGVSGLAGLSVFADAGISGQSGQKDGYAVTGFRYYFGPTKALIRRHREDDPVSLAGITGGPGGMGGLTRTRVTPTPPAPTYIG